eukprot:TRINITY_DN5002_c0_g1_i11.p1 TRINITY_DN5002_c0_g1~~TRINITY_DN5002_c0_g1_i11.p1  ORF type:complete len:469 (+),score=32.87 TRINITY_DN5002_c0_g1_i11:485-1891(+)
MHPSVREWVANRGANQGVVSATNRSCGAPTVLSSSSMTSGQRCPGGQGGQVVSVRLGRFHPEDPAKHAAFMAWPCHPWNAAVTKYDVEAAVAEAAAAAAVPAPAPAPAPAAVQVQPLGGGVLLQMPPVKTLPVTSEAGTQVGDVVVCCSPGRVDDKGSDCLADLNRVVKALLRQTLGVDSLHVRTVPDDTWRDIVKESGDGIPDVTDSDMSVMMELSLKPEDDGDLKEEKTWIWEIGTKSKSGEYKFDVPTYRSSTNPSEWNLYKKWSRMVNNIARVCNCLPSPLAELHAAPPESPGDVGPVMSIFASGGFGRYHKALHYDETPSLFRAVAGTTNFVVGPIIPPDLWPVRTKGITRAIVWNPATPEAEEPVPYHPGSTWFARGRDASTDPSPAGFDTSLLRWMSVTTGDCITIPEYVVHSMVCVTPRLSVTSYESSCFDILAPSPPPPSSAPVNTLPLPHILHFPPLR